MSLDPTRIDIEFDPQRQHMVGISAHGYQRFDVPFISEVLPDLWLGGCEDGLILPAFISNLVSLSPWETYTVRHELRRTLEVRMLDSVDQGVSKDLRQDEGDHREERQAENQAEHQCPRVCFRLDHRPVESPHRPVGCGVLGSGRVVGTAAEVAAIRAGTFDDGALLAHWAPRALAGGRVHSLPLSVDGSHLVHHRSLYGQAGY